MASELEKIFPILKNKTSGITDNKQIKKSNFLKKDFIDLMSNVIVISFIRIKKNIQRIKFLDFMPVSSTHI